MGIWMSELVLSPPQFNIISSNKRFKVAVAGRRFGKTYAAIASLLVGAGEPDTINWFVAPTYRQAKQIAWRMLKRLTPATWAGKANETDLTLRFPWGSEISLRGADKPDSLKGVSLNSVVLDEYALMDGSAWEEVFRPALADKQGSALFIGTPKGYNHFYDLWVTAATRGESWGAWSYTTAQGGNVTEEELAAAKAEMDERIFRQEFMASFEVLSGRVYYNFSRDTHISHSIADVEPAELRVGMDFNINPMSAVLAVIVAGQLHVFDTIEIPNGNTEIMSKELLRRYPNRTIVVYPDPSGSRRVTSAPVGRTDFSILRDHGFTVISPKSAPLVVDRVNEVNALFRNKDGQARCFVSPRAKPLIKALEGLTYKEGTNFPDKTTGLDHMADALGYLIHSEFPMSCNLAFSQHFPL